MKANLRAKDVMAVGSDISEGAGKIIVEAMKEKGYNYKEAFTLKEDITTSNASALYITALASIIREVVEPNLVALELLDLNTDLMGGRGKGAIKLPKDSKITAATVSEGGTITYTGQGYSSVTVTPEKRVAASKITWEMVKRGMVSMVLKEAKRIGKALARKIDSDILSAIEAVVTSGNANRTVTGGSSTRVSYAKLMDAIGSFTANDYVFRYLVLHPVDYAKLMQDSNFKTSVLTQPVIAAQAGGLVGTNPPFVGQGNAHLRPVTYFSNAIVIITSQVTSGTTLMVDSDELGTFVKESDVEVVDGRISGSVDTEVIGLISYGIAIENVLAVHGLIMAAS